MLIAATHVIEQSYPNVQLVAKVWSNGQKVKTEKNSVQQSVIILFYQGARYVTRVWTIGSFQKVLNIARMSVIWKLGRSVSVVINQ
jgi:hypothetical protein